MCSGFCALISTHILQDSKSYVDDKTLRQLMEKGAVDELSNLKDIIMKDIHIAGRFRGHRSCDKIAQCLIPSDISPTWKNAVAVESSGDGNCLFNSVSICLTGDESKAKVLRKATAIELFIHADQYMNHPKLHNAAQDPTMFSSNIYTLGATLLAPDASCFELDHLGAFKREAMLTLTPKGWMGQLAVMALASLLSCQIYSTYPDVNPTFRPFYGLVKPLKRCIHPEICILWSRTGGFDKNAQAFECNHVVPLILLGPAEPGTSVQLRTVKKPSERKQARISSFFSRPQKSVVCDVDKPPEAHISRPQKSVVCDVDKAPEARISRPQKSVVCDVDKPPEAHISRPQKSVVRDVDKPPEAHISRPQKSAVRDVDKPPEAHISRPQKSVVRDNRPSPPIGTGMNIFKYILYVNSTK